MDLYELSKPASGLRESRVPRWVARLPTVPARVQPAIPLEEEHAL